jgi:hypothetical protein
MNIKGYRSVILSTLALFAGMLVIPVASSDEMTPTSLMFDDATYTAEVDKGHQKLHVLYGKALNKSLPAMKREKARRDYFKLSQDLNKRMHSRVMMLNPKKGAALSHTDILLSTHLLLMTADMLSTIQQDAWEEDNRLSN